MAPPKKSESGDGIEEGLKTVYTQVAALNLEPNLSPQDKQFVGQLSQAIVQFLQQRAQQKAQQAAMMQQMQAQHAMQMGPGMGGGAGQMGQPGAPNPQAGAPHPGAPGGPPSQGAPGIAMPNPDELQRVLAMAGRNG